MFPKKTKRLKTRKKLEVNNSVNKGIQREYSQKAKLFGESTLRRSGEVCRAKGLDVKFYHGLDIANLKFAINKIK